MWVESLWLASQSPSMTYTLHLKHEALNSPGCLAANIDSEREDVCHSSYLQSNQSG